MKNCIENPNHLAPDLSEFSPASKKKLTRHLSGEKVDPSSLTDEDVRLFTVAARTWKQPSLGDMCKQAREHILKTRHDGIDRRRTQSENVVGHTSHASPLRREASAQSFDQPRAIRSIDGTSYMLLFGEVKGKTGVVVYGIRNRRIHQKAVDISKAPANLRCVSSGYIDDAPFLFFLHVDQKNHVTLTSYDVLEEKMKSRAKYKEKFELTSMVSIGNCLACFRRNSDIVDMYNIAENKWTRPFKLFHPVNLPVVVSHEERMYIFSEKIVQCYDVISRTVKESDISEFVSSGHGFVYDGTLNILSDNSRIEYDVISGHCRRFDFPYFEYRSIHKAFVRNGLVYVIVTNAAGNFELRCSNNLIEWDKVLSFPKTLELICTEVLDYTSPCPFAPFETFDESIKQPKFTLALPR